MADGVGSVRRWRRWSVLPRLVSDAPPRLLLVVGVAMVALAMVLVARPLTSLLVLGIYVGASAIVSGLIELRSPSKVWWSRAIAIVWIAFGIVVLVWLGRSLDFLPLALSLLLILGGLGSIGHALFEGRVSERVLSATWGAAQLVFGILALTYLDVTVLLAALVFGVWMLVFGVVLFVRGLQAILGPPPQRSPRSERRARRWADAGRFALAVVLVGVMAAGWAVDDWLSRGAPVVDAFYDPPSDVPADHGQLIRFDDYGGRHPSNGDVIRILYTTRDAVGRPAVASALVISPTDAHPGPRPVVSWNHGTTGVARACAPSLRNDAATKWAIPALEDALDKGWIIVASDYSGQGAPGVFPYLIGKGEAKSSLDAVLAARRLKGLWLSRDVVAWGHSQGGHAALWETQLAPEYAPLLRVKGTAVLSPVTDPVALARRLITGDANALLSVLISWVLVPYADTYPEVELGDYIAPGARAIVREMTQRCPSEPGVIVSVVSALGVSEDRPLYSGDLMAGALGRRLAQNIVKGPFTEPVLMTWGTADEVVPPALQEAFVTTQCQEGTHLRWVAMQGYDHLGVLLPGSGFLPTLVRWTDARFTGRGDPDDDCGR
ncbi:lipase family protein [Microbacterium sp. B2969]|uniref:Lipase family protein n=1 Tax=Microbacterium alkaliflavum TaxID=3248839 RepID=A0ABW7Q8E4_9MICO